MNYQAVRQEDNFEQLCEQDVHALGEQLKHVKTYAPSVVRAHKEQLVKILIEFAQYAEDLK